MKKFIFVWMIMALLSIVAVTAAQEDGSQFIGREEFPAPDFAEGLDWINVDRPLSIEELRGKMVVLDFWTYGCINCIHMIPVLEQLEAKYGDALVVIGVHSAKFDNEGQTENIRQIVQRYELHHPVINDNQFVVWQTYGPYGVQGWPTFVVIDPRGNILAVQSSEIPFESFDRVIGGMETFFDGTGELNRDPLELTLETEARATTALAFPGKVLADPVGNRLFITDTNNNRIVISDLTTYEVLDVIGNGSRGFEDGDFSGATFNKPQGLTLSDDNILYIADVNNHAIRAVDLTGRSVTTIAGTGEQAPFRTGAGPALQTPLSSPWDVELGDNNTLYIAMAGPHQLWAMTLDENMVFPFVGNGREGLVDGPFSESRLAQPSGLYYDDGLLYFADSESSSIRVADIRDNSVRTLAGPKGDVSTRLDEAALNNLLFEFGDVDGEVGTSRLQHALGVVAGDDGQLFVADTYNSKIKVLDPQTTEISTLYGLGGLGDFRDGPADVAAFDEPGGLDYADGKLYVADTNNHAIRVIDLETNEVSTVTFPNPELLQIADQPTVVAGNAAMGLQITLPEQTLAAGDGEIELQISLPEGYKLNNLAPFSSEWHSDDEAISIAEENLKQVIIEPELPLLVPVALEEGSDTLHGDLTIYYCEAVKESLCFIEQVRIDVPVVVGEGSGSTILLTHEIVPPEVNTSGF